MGINLDDLQLEFPCEFPLKIIGVNNDEFENEVIEILLRHVPDLSPENIASRLSSGSKYRALSTSFTAATRAQVDALYIELTAHRDVRWVL